VPNVTDLARRKQAEERLRLLSEVTQEFSAATRDHHRLLEVIARRLSAVVGDLCVVRLTQADGEGLEPVGSIHHPDPEVVALVRKPLIEGPVPKSPATLAGRVLETGRAVYLPEVDPREYGAVIAPRFTGPLEVRSAIAVPLLVEGKVIGVIKLIRNKAGHPYTRDDLGLVEELARHAALALANARLFDAAEKLTLRQRLLSELTRVFARSTGDYHLLLNLIAKRLGEILGETCLIRIIPAEGDHFGTVKGLYHPDPEFAIEWREYLNANPQHLHEGSAGRVLLTGKPLLVPRTTPDELAAPVQRHRGMIERLKIRSLMAVPLRSEGNPIGVAIMTRSEPGRPYTREDLELLDDIASHASIALTNGMLLDQVRRELAERKRAEAHLRATEEQLRQAQKMEAIGRLAGGVAHDFNNILSVILGHATLLIEDLPAAEPMRDDLEEIRTASQSGAALTARLLAFSRQQLVQPAILDLDEVLRSMEKMNRRLLGEDIDYVTLSAQDLYRVKADRGHVEQVIMNLVVNARDAMPRGGRLTLQTANVELDADYAREHFDATPGPHVMLAVSDTGVGMDRETQLRLFEPFFTTKERGKGTGLGLSTVFGIVKQSGGSIFVESEPGKGTTFRIYFPATDELEGEPSQRVPAAALDGAETVLLVEDDDQVRAVTRLILSRRGYRVLEARDGVEALAIAEAARDPIDLLLTDVVMPNMGGRELADRLLALRPGTPVLYMSGYTDDAIVHHRVLDPGVMLLQKPVTPEALLRKVRTVLETRG
jgi:signal transduction histidine kinase/CheY-like chemotaxis protein